MRKFIGHKVKIAVQELGMVQGTVINETKDRIMVKGEDDKVTRVIKSKVCAFTPLDFEPEDYVPFHVLYCQNRAKKCPGVRFVQEGEGFRPKDVEVFMGPCPCRDDSCSYGSKGEIHSVAGGFLREMFADTIYGDYPKNKEVKSAGSTGPSGKTERSESEGSGAVSGEESDNGGAERAEEASGGVGESLQE